jgi:hypothetical protein
MEQEYTISTTMKITCRIFSAVILVFAVFIVCLPKGPGINTAVFIFPALIMLLPIILMMEVISKKITINDTYITTTSIFSNRQLAINDIRGYRAVQNKGSKSFILEPVTPGNPIIRIGSYTSFNNSAELATWIDKFQNLDDIDLKNEQQELLQDMRFGVTEAEREQNIKNIKLVANTYNIAGVVIALGMAFLPFKISTVVLIGYPLAGFAVLLYGKGLIKFFSNPKRSIYPTMAFGFLFSCLVMLLKSVILYHITSAENLWLPAFTTSGIMFVLLCLTGINKNMKFVIGQGVLLVLLSLMFGFGSVLQVNGMFDDSTLRVYNARVLGHRVSHGKSNSYYLTLSAWGSRQYTKEVEVDQSLYDIKNIGDSVKVNFKEGKLHIPWFTVSL